MVAAVSELEKEYSDKVNFNIVGAEDTAKRMDEVLGFGFEAQRHGLVAFDGEGEAQAKLPGHNFGAKEIRAAIEKVIAER